MPMLSTSSSPPASADAAAIPPADAPLAVYVHWPFCRSKCPYCDFNSHVREQIDEDRWRTAYLAQLRRLAADTPGRTVASVFFGGGTPSLMQPSTAASVLEAIAGLWLLAPDVEVTLEANPSTAEAQRFRDFREAGIERLSIGVQALDDEALRILGRGHSAAEAVAAVDLAGRVFPRFSFDLIWGRPGQRPTEQHQVPLAEDGDPAWARTMVEQAADGMAGAAFRAVRGSGCRICPARVSCPAQDAGRQVTG